MFGVAFRDTLRGQRADGELLLGIGAGFRDAHLHLADRGEVFVQLALVVGAEADVQFAKVFAHQIEDRLALRIATLAFEVRTRAEEAIKDQLRVHFLRHRLRGRAPGDIGLVDAGVARVAAPGELAGFGTDFEGSEARTVTDAGGRELVGRDTGADVGAVGLARLGAREEGGHRARVVAAAVTVGAGLVGREAREHREIFPDVSKRREDRRKFGRKRPFGADAPAVHVHAVRDVEERHAVRGGVLRGRIAGSPTSLETHRFKPRQSHDGTEAFEHRAAGNEVSLHSREVTS